MPEDEVQTHRERSVHWWYFDEGRRFGLEAELPAADGAIVARALQRLSRTIPVMPDEDAKAFAPARRADALVALASASVSADPDPDRATVVIHAQAGALSAGGDGEVQGGCEIQDGPVIHPETAKRILALICSFRHRLVHEHGWRIERDAGGRLEWFHPGSVPHRAGPTRVERTARGPTLAAAG